MSNSVRPHRWQPTRLPCPGDSPCKNTGVGCHFLLQCMKVKSESEVAQLCPTLCDPMDCSLPGSSSHWIFQARVLDWGARSISSSAIISKKCRLQGWEQSHVMSPLVMGTNFSFSCSVMLNCLWPHGLHHTSLPWLPLSPRVCSNSCPLSWWILPKMEELCLWERKLLSGPAGFSTAGKNRGLWFEKAAGKTRMHKVTDAQ